MALPRSIDHLIPTSRSGTKSPPGTGWALGAFLLLLVCAGLLAIVAYQLDRPHWQYIQHGDWANSGVFDSRSGVYCSLNNTATRTCVVIASKDLFDRARSHGIAVEEPPSPSAQK